MYSTDVTRLYSFSETVFTLSAKRSILFLPFFGGEAEFVVPLLPKPADEGFLEELVKRQVQFVTQLARRVTNIPPMVLYACQIAYLRKPNGIQVTGYGLLESTNPLIP